jgi:hypothetical protein
MNLYLLSTDDELEEAFKNFSVFENVTTINSIENVEASDKKSIIVISSDFLPYDELSELSYNPDTTIFYMHRNNAFHNVDKIAKAICDGKGIHYIPSRLKVEQIVKIIMDIIHPQNSEINNAVTFFSSIGNAGTTTTCLSVAMALKEYTRANIGVLLINAWDDGVDQINFKGHYLNDIKGTLSGQLIQSEEEFLSLFHMIKENSLYVLAGNKDTKLERLFTIDEIHYLIQKAKEVFDIVLIDVGSHFDNANMVQALKEGDLKFLIVNQQHKSIKKFNYVYDDVLYPLGFKRTDFLMIINDYEDESLLPTTKSIYAEMSVPLISTITRNRYGKLAEIEQRSLYTFDDILYQEGINNIARTIASHVEVDFELNNSPVKKRGMMKLFSR